MQDPEHQNTEAIKELLTERRKILRSRDLHWLSCRIDLQSNKERLAMLGFCVDERYEGDPVYTADEENDILRQKRLLNNCKSFSDLFFQSVFNSAE